MNTPPIKACDYCKKTGTMPTFRDGETVCTSCLSKSADMTRGKYLALQAEVERLQREIANLQIEVTNLRGLKPEIPPMPGENWPKELPRYILRENGPRRPRSVPHKDGYWTPWYIANRLYEELERERKAAKTACENWGEMKRERDQLIAYQAELVRELTSCQSVLHMLAHAGEVTPAYADDAKAVLKRKSEHSLAQHDAEVIERFKKAALETAGLSAGCVQLAAPEEVHRTWVQFANHYSDQLHQQVKEVQS